MVIHFQKTLPEALQDIQFTGECKEFVVHEAETVVRHSSVFIDHYGNAKWDVVDTLNARYGAQLPFLIDLLHWLHYEENDEVAYFLSEAGSNALHNSEFKAPFKFCIWFGRKGFVLGMEQKGKGFDAHRVVKENIKENEGAAFEFYGKCQSTIFFDDPLNAKQVYLAFMI
ncbi:MAG: hypothetical protein AABX37_00505 [Nanoarchaeota archaeon]